MNSAGLSNAAIVGQLGHHSAPPIGSDDEIPASIVIKSPPHTRWLSHPQLPLIVHLSSPGSGCLHGVGQQWSSVQIRGRYQLLEITVPDVHGIEPHARLTDVLNRLPTTRDYDIDSLLPLA